MDTIQQEATKEMTLKDKHQAFQEELGKIVTRHNEATEKKRESYLQYHRKISERQDLIAIGEIEEASKLDKEINSLRSQVEKYDKEISDLSFERIKETIAKYPDSKLFKMASDIQEEGLKEIEIVLTEINQTNDEIEKAKQTYLELIKKAGQQYRILVNIHSMVKRAEEMLPEKKNKHLPRIPNWDDFNINEKELSKAFGRRPFTG